MEDQQILTGLSHYHRLLYPFHNYGRFCCFTNFYSITRFLSKNTFLLALLHCHTRVPSIITQQFFTYVKEQLTNTLSCLVMYRSFSQ
jgi:hypothetical protein